MTTPKQLTRVLMMAGGTGGHIFPGLAVANYFRQHDIEIHWLGTPIGLEAKVVPEANIPIHLINVKGIRGKGFKSLLSAPTTISKAILQSMKVIKQINPDVVIGMGGFVSGPGGMASWLAGKPLIIHEQNARPGTTNKLLQRFSRRVLEGFPNVFKAHKKVIHTGNPVRIEIEQVEPPEERLRREKGPLRLLILGGSLGAQALNEMVPQAMAQLNPSERPTILHQTGIKNFEQTKNLYESLGIGGNLQPFIEDMAKAYSWADLVICRAGALTVAELCAVGLGAIFVPYPYAIDDHQTANAEFMVKNHAAICIQQRDLTATQLADIVREFTLTPEKCLLFAKAAYQLRQVQVVERILAICKEVCP